MAKRHTIKGRTSGSGRFLQLHHYLMASEAWKALTAQQRAVYIEVAALYAGNNNGRIALSVRNAAERCNITKDTAAKAFKRLIELGFIDCVTPGGFSRKVRHAAEWRLNMYKCDVTGAVASKAFMRWSIKNQNTVPFKSSHRPKSGSMDAITRK